MSITKLHLHLRKYRKLNRILSFYTFKYFTSFSKIKNKSYLPRLDNIGLNKLMNYYLNERKETNSSILFKINKLNSNIINTISPEKLSSKYMNNRKTCLKCLYSFLLLQKNNEDLNNDFKENFIKKFERLFYIIVSFYDYYVSKLEVINDTLEKIYIDIFTCFFIIAKYENISCYNMAKNMIDIICNFYLQVRNHTNTSTLNSLKVTEEDLSSNQTRILNTCRFNIYPTSVMDYFYIIMDEIQKKKEIGLDDYNTIIYSFNAKVFLFLYNNSIYSYNPSHLCNLIMKFVLIEDIKDNKIILCVKNILQNIFGNLNITDSDSQKFLYDFYKLKEEIIFELAEK